MSKYNLRSSNEPVLSGWGLKAFAYALGNPLLRPTLVKKMIRSGGLDKLRSLKLDESPTHNPLYPRPCDEQDGRASNTAGGVADATLTPSANRTGFCSTRDLAQAYRAGTTTPLQVAEKLLQAMVESERGERPLRAITACDRDQLLQQAKASTERIAADQALGMFDGIPVAFKEELDVKGFPTTVGTAFLGSEPATHDATVAARLRAAGALIVGKTNMHEIGINPHGINLHHGSVRNPYDLNRDSGGSSSGSAAAVAAGLCPMAIGADGGGSIRIPAALCGVVGLKATYGRISSHGSFPLDWSVGHLGPIGATVDDVALAYEAIAGPDPLDPNTLRQPSLDFGVDPSGSGGKELSSLRLGIYREWFSHADPEIVASCESMLKQLVDRGMQLIEIEIPQLDELRLAHGVTILSEMATSMANYPQHWNELSPSTRISLTLGGSVTSADYLKAQQVRTRAINYFAGIYKEVDVIVSPATGVLAPPLTAQSQSQGVSDMNLVSELMRFVVPGNMAGLPAISFPVGYSRSGLPIAMQAMGRPWEESLLLNLARTIEGLVDQQLPASYYNLLS